MIEREINLPPESQYPVEPWRFIQKKLNKEQIGRDEAIFTVSNGYIGIRGNFEEGEPVNQLGTYISGFYESWPIKYGEEAHGFAKTGQTMLSVTDDNQHNHPTSDGIRLDRRKSRPCGNFWYSEGVVVRAVQS